MVLLPQPRMRDLPTSFAGRIQRTGPWLALALSAAVLGAEPAEENPATGREDLVRITHLVKPEFPTVALAEGVGTGEARVMFEVDEFGQLGDLLVTAYTRKEFADATVAAVREWRFLPARKGGKPVRTVMTVEYEFGIQGMLFIDRKGPGGDSGIGRHPGSKYLFAPCGAAELDRRLQPLERMAPAFPQKLREEGHTGRVVVEFFIDGEGRARFPKVVTSVHPILAAAAVQAVKEWRFEPPRRRGQPALVRAVQAFDFTPLAQR